MCIEEKEIRQLVERLRNELVPIGSILIYPAQKVPSGYLPCDGSELSKKVYPELYSIIGDTWGETESSFFLPDLQGQFVRGWDKDGDVDPERLLGTFQEDALQGHTHYVESKSTTSEYAGSHSHGFYMDEHGGGMGTYFDCLSTRSSYKAKNKAICRESCDSGGSHSHTLKADVTILDPKDSKFGEVKVGVETRPKNIALMFCIKVK